MMYGHVEETDDLLDHLDAIRELQDAFGGFTAFVPWSFKPGNTLLEKWIKHPKGPNMYLRMLAVSRLYLDNFPTSRRRGSRRASAPARSRSASARTTGAARSSRRTCTRPRIS